MTTLKKLFLGLTIVVPLDIARRIDHDEPRPKSMPAQPTAEYGARLAR